MALALGVKKGSVLHVGASPLRVLSVQGSNVLVNFGGKDTLVNELERQEVCKDVFLSTAKSKNNDGRTRLVFEAPQEIRIVREPDYVGSN